MSEPVWAQQVRIPTPEAMHELGVTVGTSLRAGDLLILDGPLGAGKTTLTRGIGQGLGVRGPVTSPTFALARTHPSLVNGPALTHVDAYRLGSADEFDDLDLDLDGAVVVVEWGKGMMSPGESWIEATLERPTGATATDSELEGEEPIEPRTVRFAAYGSRWAEGMTI